MSEQLPDGHGAKGQFLEPVGMEIMSLTRVSRLGSLALMSFKTADKVAAASVSEARSYTVSSLTGALASQ